MYTMDISINQNAFPDSDTLPNKRRRKKSMVWDHFTIEKVNPECVRAFCNQCKKSFAYVSGSKLAGTSHLKRHIALGICPVSRKNQDKGRMSPQAPPVRNNISTNGTNIPRKRVRATNSVTTTYFNHDNSGNELAKMIIQHDYPLQMVEQTGFLNFVRSLQPQFSTSASKVQEQIMGIYMRERQKLMELLSRIPGRLNLTVDLCTSDQSLSYVLLTAHFTDHEWKLQKRVLSVSVVHFPDSCTLINHAIATCLSDWSIEGMLSTVTLDHSYADESTGENLRSLLSIKSPHVLKGQLLISSCYAHMLRSLAQDAIGSMRETVENVRQSVKYVKTSDVNEERFSKLRHQLQVPSTKNLMLDDLTKWNTTYHMLIAAWELKEVFHCLDTCDPDYKLTPSVEEWGNVETLCSYLKIFYEAANILMSPCPTTNSFFDVVWKIHFELLNAASSQDLFVSTFIRPLLERFTKYWEDCYLVLSIAAVMDPRFKMKFVRFSFERIYGEDVEAWFRIVDHGLHELFLDYALLSLSDPTTIDEGDEHLVKTEVPPGDELYSDQGDFLDFDVDVSDIMGETHARSELDQYLEESVLPRVQDFDVLGWWKVNRLKYPTLSKLASDVLAIPLSTVPLEFVFDTRNRKIDGYLSSLRPSTAQALICAKDWLRYESTTEIPVEIPSESHALIVKTEI